MNITLSPSALLEVALYGIAATLVALADLHLGPLWLAHLGFALALWGVALYLERRMRRHAAALARRELDAYEAGRLRGL
jgi:hypothetical protein